MIQKHLKKKKTKLFLKGHKLRKKTQKVGKIFSNFMALSEIIIFYAKLLKSKVFFCIQVLMQKSKHLCQTERNLKRIQFNIAKSSSSNRGLASGGKGGGPGRLQPPWNLGVQLTLLQPGYMKGRYRKVASTNASRFVTRLVYMHTQNDNFLIRSSS